jgi:hypothetical protein
MLAVFFIALGLMVLLGDPSVKNVDGVKKLEKIASGTKDALTGNTGAPKPSQDFIGWLFWSGK